jgi:hypothetical protein
MRRGEPPVLRIDFVEVTQGVQEDRDLVAAGRGMPTVAWKDTAVRVHISCDRGGWYFDRADEVTGSLQVDGRGLLPPTNKYRSITVLGHARPDETESTLNFTAAWCSPGPHTLAVRVVCPDPSGRVTTGQVVTWSWAAKAPLRLACMRFGTPRTEEQRLGEMRWALEYVRKVVDFLPTPLTDITVLPVAWWYEDRYHITSRDEWDDLLESTKRITLGALGGSSCASSPGGHPGSIRSGRGDR